jgi:hypothetical protein
MSTTLDQILDLVRPLDDSAGADTPRERFRRFLPKNVRPLARVSRPVIDRGLSPSTKTRVYEGADRDPLQIA